MQDQFTQDEVTGIVRRLEGPELKVAQASALLFEARDELRVSSPQDAEVLDGLARVVMYTEACARN